MSASVTSRPLIISAKAMFMDTSGPKTAVNVRSTSGTCHGGSASTTSWPSDTSSSAASRTERSASASSGEPSSGGLVVIAIRSRSGARAAAAANGSAGSGAHSGSPGS